MSKVDKEKLTEIAKKYIPDVVYLPTPVIISIMENNRRYNMRRASELQKAYGNADLAMREYRRRTRSNNWLKLHGLPMRRKCHKGKRGA